MPARIHTYLRSVRGTGQGTGGLHKQHGTHKAYPRMPLAKLPKPRAFPTTLGEALRTRVSSAEPTARLSAQHISTLLHAALDPRDDGHRPYPSAGGLYPVEIYLLVRDVSALSNGVYHFNPTKKALEHLWDVPDDFDPKTFTPTTPTARAYMVFTSVWARTCAKYGDFGYMHALLETGHIAQNVLLVAAALKLSARPLGGFEDEKLFDVLDLDQEREQPIYVIALQ